MRCAVSSLEEKRARLGAFVVGAVADEVEDVKVVRAVERALQLPQGCALKPPQLDLALRLKIVQSLLEIAALLVGVERSAVARVAVDAEDSQRELHPSRSTHRFQVERTHHRRFDRMGKEHRAVVQEFPRDVL